MCSTFVIVGTIILIREFVIKKNKNGKKTYEYQ